MGVLLLGKSGLNSGGGGWKTICVWVPPIDSSAACWLAGLLAAVQGWTTHLRAYLLYH
jgi:hypothetical protein